MVFSPFQSERGVLCIPCMSKPVDDLKTFQIPFFNHSLKVVYSSLGLVEMTFINEKAPRTNKFTPFEKNIKEQVQSYFLKKNKNWNLPIDWDHLEVTPFQQKVLQKMAQIPYGEVMTYSELAQAAGSPRGARAVGSTCASNPIILVIPCHRVVSTQGLGGYSGGGLAIKRRLLQLEQTQ